jgi:RNA chaperone Hfq
METNLLDRMLNTYQADKTIVTVTLRNKIRVFGTVTAFDSYVIVMDGQKRGIVYRHAVSTLAPHAAEELKLPVPSPAPRPPQVKPAAYVPKPAAKKPRQHPPQPALSASSSSGESGINSSMKEGLLKWMREQKADK